MLNSPFGVDWKSLDALKAQGELVKKSYDDKIARLERELAAAQKAEWQEQQKTKDFLEWLSQGNNQGESMKQAAARQKAEWDEEQKTKKMLEWLSQGDKMKKEIIYTERGHDIQLCDLEIAIDSSDDSKIEIYILDEKEERVEGGTFSKDDFMVVVRDFYNKNY